MEYGVLGHTPYLEEQLFDAEITPMKGLEHLHEHRIATRPRWNYGIRSTEKLAEITYPGPGVS